MSENLKKHVKDLEFVSKIKCPKTKKQMLKYLSNNKNIYLALKEICCNLIKGNINISKKHKSKLNKHKKVIKEIVYKSKPIVKHRQKLVVQSVGGMWIIPLIYLIIDIFKK